MVFPWLRSRRALSLVAALVCLGGSSTTWALIDCRVFLLSQGRQHLSWPSHFLNGKVLRSVQETSQVLELAATNSGLRAEMKNYLDALGGVENLRQNPRLWALYLDLYDAFVPFSTGYRQLIDFYDTYLARSGQILDVGSGTGSIGAGLMLGSPQRTINFMDMSAESLRHAREKATLVENYFGLGTPLDFQFSTENILSFIDYPQPLAGAVANLSLYNIPQVNHLSIIKWIHHQLSDGAYFGLAEPDPNVVHSEEDLEEAAQRVILSAVQEGTVATDFEASLLFYINTQKLKGHFRTGAEWLELASIAGFHLVRTDHSLYYGIVNSYMLQK